MTYLIRHQEVSSVVCANLMAVVLEVGVCRDFVPVYEVQGLLFR